MTRPADAAPVVVLEKCNSARYFIVVKVDHEVDPSSSGAAAGWAIWVNELGSCGIGRPFCDDVSRRFRCRTSSSWSWTRFYCSFPAVTPSWCAASKCGPFRDRRALRSWRGFLLSLRIVIGSTTWREEMNCWISMSGCVQSFDISADAQFCPFPCSAVGQSTEVAKDNVVVSVGLVPVVHHRQVNERTRDRHLLLAQRRWIEFFCSLSPCTVQMRP